MKAIIALIVIIIIAAVVVVFFVLGGSDDEEGGGSEVAIQIENADNLGALHIELVYDPSLITVSEVTLGEIAENGQLDYEQAVPGRLVIGVIDAMGIDGSGTIVELDFEEKQGGRSDLSLENVTATDAETLYDLIVETSAGALDTENETSKNPVISMVP